MKNKKNSQVTIFVIVALLIVGVIVFLFLVKPQNVPDAGLMRENPRSWIEKCEKESTQQIMDIIVPKGGLQNPSPYFNFNGNKIMMLCYTPFDWQLCINKHPMLNKETEKEIYDFIKPKIEKCFDDLKSQLQNYKAGEMNLSVKIEQKSVKIEVNKKISFTRNDEAMSIEQFNSEIDSALFDFIRLSNEIANKELSCDCLHESCNADLIQMTFANRNFEITKPVYESSGEEVYVIKEISTGKKFNFAVRNCVKSP